MSAQRYSATGGNDPDPLDVTTPWRSVDPSTLTTSRLLADLLSYDDGFNGRGLRATADEEAIVGQWIRTPRGYELAERLRTGQAKYRDSLYVAGQEDGYESGIRDNLPRRAVVALVAIVAGIVGVLIGFAAGTMT